MAAVWMAGCWKSKWRSMGDLIDLGTRKKCPAQRAVTAVRNGVPSEVEAEAVSAVPVEAPSETTQEGKKTRKEAQVQKTKKEAQVQKKKGEAVARNRRAEAPVRREQKSPAAPNLPSRGLALVPAHDPNDVVD